MSEPTFRARELMQASRDLHRPTVADRERIQKALRVRLGVVVLPLQAHGVPLAANLPWALASTVVMGAVLIAAALLFANRQGPRAIDLARTAAVPVAVSGSTAAALTPPAESISVSMSPAVVSSERPPPQAPPVEEPLAQEVTLLARAVTDLHAGRVVKALKALDEHQRRFPNGLLTEERRAARAQALCALGRRGEAEAELAQLAPQSLAAARAKQVCDVRSNADR